VSNGGVLQLLEANGTSVFTCVRMSFPFPFLPLVQNLLQENQMDGKVGPTAKGRQASALASLDDSQESRLVHAKKVKQRQQHDTN
jgi:hypothetical protein